MRPPPRPPKYVAPQPVKGVVHPSKLPSVAELQVTHAALDALIERARWHMGPDIGFAGMGPGAGI